MKKIKRGKRIEKRALTHEGQHIKQRETMNKYKKVCVRREKSKA